jgi:hypothetical protein
MKIGVLIDHAENPKTGAMPAYKQLRGLARTAEAVRLYRQNTA